MREQLGAAIDGRRLRAERSRERILDAVAEALADPEVSITPTAIAARAGVSLSTIVRHFRNRDGLVSALRDRIRDQVMPIVAAGPFEGDLPTRIDELVRRRMAIFALVAPAYHAAPRDKDAQSWRERRDLLEQVLLAQLRDALASELTQDSDQEALLVAQLSFATWNQLRNTQGIAAEKVHELLKRGTIALLG